MKLSKTCRTCYYRTTTYRGHNSVCSYMLETGLKRGEKIARTEGFTDEEIEEYRSYVEVFAKRYGANQE